MTVVLCVTGDKFELPMFVADTPAEMARIVGTTRENVASQICKNRQFPMRRPVKGRKFIQVEIGELEI